MAHFVCNSNGHNVDNNDDNDKDDDNDVDDDDDDDDECRLRLGAWTIWRVIGSRQTLLDLSFPLFQHSALILHPVQHCATLCNITSSLLSAVILHLVQHCATSSHLCWTVNFYSFLFQHSAVILNLVATLCCYSPPCCNTLQYYVTSSLLCCTVNFCFNTLLSVVILHLVQHCATLCNLVSSLLHCELLLFFVSTLCCYPPTCFNTLAAVILHPMQYSHSLCNLVSAALCIVNMHFAMCTLHFAILYSV